MSVWSDCFCVTYNRIEEKRSNEKKVKEGLIMSFNAKLIIKDPISTKLIYRRFIAAL